jgi:hypothetical protein
MNVVISSSFNNLQHKLIGYLIINIFIFITLLIFSPNKCYAKENILIAGESISGSKSLLNEDLIPPDSGIEAGFRASRILSSYPKNQFPPPDYWTMVGNKMSQKFNEASPTGIWIVSLYQDSGYTQVDFPAEGNNYPFIIYGDSDLNESYLTFFDQKGTNIYLQVEPGDANVDTLISLMLTRYGHHKCVIGFGIDIEWLNPDTNINGRPVTDAEAKRWEAKVRSFNSKYKFFLKHFWTNRMPQNYRGNIIFIDDGQQFQSLDEMVNNFQSWSNFFPLNKVGFQLGYPADEVWWDKLSDPPNTIGNAILDSISNTYGLFWVDFTVTQVFPETIASVKNNNTALKDYNLLQNFPNPFNPVTNIKYKIDSPGHVILNVYNILGNKISTLVNDFKQPGEYTVQFSGINLPGGVYIYELQSMGKKLENKMILLK